MRACVFVCVSWKCARIKPLLSTFLFDKYKTVPRAPTDIVLTNVKHYSIYIA